MLKLYAINKKRMMRQRQRRNVSVLLILSVLFFGLLLSGCASQPPAPCHPARIPEPPPSTMEAPQQSYQQNVLTLLQRWQDVLTGGEVKP